jgi:hypothetical protein
MNPLVHTTAHWMMDLDDVFANDPDVLSTYKVLTLWLFLTPCLIVTRRINLFVHMLGQKYFRCRVGF